MLGLFGAAMIAILGGEQASAVPTAGTVSIMPAGGAAGAAFDTAVQRALLDRGFTPLPGNGHGRYLAKVDVTQSAQGVVSAGRAPAGKPLASFNGSVSLGLSPGGDRLSELVVTRLTVTLIRRDGGQVVWSGSATTARVAGSRNGGVDLVAQTLANAVLSQFPHTVGQTISIP